jgi:hypothetical protein
MTAAFNPPLRTELTRYVYIPTRDGTHLAADIYRPATEGRFPCLMVRTPYNKNGFNREEADFYVRRGYVLCVVDARGTGGSEGDFTYYNIPAGLGDGADIVNWLAEQPFCNGRVGTFGGSALGTYQILTARGKPDALQAMFVEVAPIDFYHDNWFVGGIFETASRIGWIEGMTPRIGPSVAVEDVDGEIDPEGAQRRRNVMLRRTRLRDERALRGECPTPQGWFPPMRSHTEYDSFWEERCYKDVIRACDIPTCYVGTWYDHFVRASCESYTLHRGPKQLILVPGGQGTHGAHADVRMPEMRVRWFDRWLKGIENGVAEEPPVKTFLLGAERWRTDDAWPPPGKPYRLALSAGGRLTAPDQAEDFADEYVHDPDEPLPSVDSPLDVRPYEARALTYTSEPLTDDLTVMGRPRVTLFLRSSGVDAHVMLKLTDVFPDGRSRQVAYGRLRAAHREGHGQVVPLPPDEPVRLDVPFWPLANQFEAGHRMRLVVAGSDAPRCEVYPERTENALIGAEGMRPVLELPVV